MTDRSISVRGALSGLSLAALALGLFAAAPASAGPMGDEGYKQYHEAIHAAVICEHQKFEFSNPDNMGSSMGDARTLPLWSADRESAAESDLRHMEQMIVQKVGPGLSGNRLSLIEAAKIDANATIAREGCASPEVSSLLNLFHGDLMPMTKG